MSAGQCQWAVYMEAAMVAVGALWHTALVGVVAGVLAGGVAIMVLAITLMRLVSTPRLWCMPHPQW